MLIEGELTIKGEIFGDLLIKIGNFNVGAV